MRAPSTARDRGGRDGRRPFLATPRARSLAPLASGLLPTLLVGLLAVTAGCDSAPGQDKTLALAAVVPLSGADASLGQSLQRAVELAVSQHKDLGKGYTLTAVTVDEAAPDAASSVTGNARVRGIVGPMESASAATLIPSVAKAGLATISPGATLPALTQPDRAAASGLDAAALRPQGKPVAFFRAVADDDALGTAAADLARAKHDAHGLEANTVFVVDDGTASGKAQVAAFTKEFQAKGGKVSGQQSFAPDTPGAVDSAAVAVITAGPDAVFVGGGTSGATTLRSTLSLSGAAAVPVLAAGMAAGNPGWAASIKPAPAAANTTALLPGADPSAAQGAAAFTQAYQAAYAGKDLAPQAALAYDAAMDEISALKGVIAAGKDPTRAAVLSAVAGAKYDGAMGTLAFNANGDLATPPALAIYTSDAKAAWAYQGTVGK